MWQHVPKFPKIGVTLHPDISKTVSRMKSHRGTNMPGRLTRAVNFPKFNTSGNISKNQEVMTSIIFIQIRRYFSEHNAQS